MFKKKDDYLMELVLYTNLDLYCSKRGGSVGHGHHHHDHGEMPNTKLYWAVVINVLLTVAQIIGGLLSGSLSLLADALHNFSDAGALLIAAVAAKISKIPADEKMTYGYKRAEILGALINSTTLVIIGFYLLLEAYERFLEPELIDAWLVIGVAGIALVIDLATAMLTYSGSKESVNIRAAFIHNLSDAMASIVVIISGFLILKFQIYWVDLVATVFISIYVLYHSFYLLKQCVLILMQSTPEQINLKTLRQEIQACDGVADAHHIHVWQLDDKKVFFEAHIVIDLKNILQLEEIKQNVRQKVQALYGINHTTLEIETANECLNKG